MRSHAVFAFLVVLLAAVFVFGCAKKEEPGPAAPPPAPAVSPAASPVAEGQALFEQKCSVCHGLDRATALTGTRARWAEIVKSMQEKKADWISDAEAARIVEFLSTEHGKR